MEVTTAFGCVYCRTGSERKIASQINEQIAGVSAVVPMKIRRHYHDGECKNEKVLLLPGYIFFRCVVATKLNLLEGMPNVHSVLKYADDTWQLKGFDEEFAEFFFEHTEIGYSRAKFIDGRIHFVDGFLKGYDENVVRLNKRMKMAEIKMDINGATLWVGYEELA